jgi:hypothetical protein
VSCWSWANSSSLYIYYFVPEIYIYFFLIGIDELFENYRDSVDIFL